jgi:hypothetical protein
MKTVFRAAAIVGWMFLGIHVAVYLYRGDLSWHGFMKVNIFASVASLVKTDLPD